MCAASGADVAADAAVLPNLIPRQPTEFDIVIAANGDEDEVAILRSLSSHFPGIPSLPIEQFNAILDFIRLEDDILVLFRTSIGKSLIFQVAADILHQREAQSKILVLTALKSITCDQMMRLNKARIKCVNVASLSHGLASAFLPEHADASIIFLSPEEFVRDISVLNPACSSRISAVVFDEAHTVAAWADSFRKDFGQIGPLRKRWLPRAPIIALTGSATPAVLKTIKQSLGLGSSPEFSNRLLRSSFNRPELKFFCRNMSNFRTDIAAPIEAVLARPRESTGVMIIYVHDPRHTFILYQKTAQAMAQGFDQADIFAVDSFISRSVV